MGYIKNVEQEITQLESFDYSEKSLTTKILLIALERVERNKGSQGIDGMSVKFLKRHI